MTWINAFDLGACTVNVVLYNGDPATQVYSGTLGKGDSAEISDLGAGYSPAGGVVAVDTNGVVSLTADADGVSATDGFEIDVVPQYTHNYAARLVGPTSNLSNYHDAIASINITGSVVGVDYLEWVGPGSDPPVVPDPADLSSLTGDRDLIGFYVQSVGV